MSTAAEQQQAGPLAGGPHVEVIETSSLCDRSYVATDGERAIVIDPQPDVDRVIATAGRLGAPIALVLETHIHNDYVSGGLEIGNASGADVTLTACE